MHGVILFGAGKKAGIAKPCNPYAFRHAQATNMIQLGYNEYIIRKKLGWSSDSKMIGRYIHCVDDDVIDATQEKNGTFGTIGKYCRLCKYDC